MPPLHPSRVTEAGGRWRGTAEPTPQTAGPGQSSLPSAPGHAGARHQGRLGGSLCLDRNAAPGVAGAASVWPAPSVGVGVEVRLGSKVSALPGGSQGWEGDQRIRRPAIKRHQLCLHKGSSHCLPRRRLCG